MNRQELEQIEKDIDGLLVQYDLALSEQQYKLAHATMQQIEDILEQLKPNEIQVNTSEVSQ